MCFQIGPLLSIFQIICEFYYSVKNCLFRPFYPQFGEFGWLGPDSTSHPHKPIFYPSNYYCVSNVIRLTWIGNQVEDYTTQNCLEWYQDVYHTRILNIRRSVSGIIHTLLGVAVFGKYRYNHLYNLTPMMDMLIRIKNFSSKCKP